MEQRFSSKILTDGSKTPPSRQERNAHWPSATGSPNPSGSQNVLSYDGFSTWLASFAHSSPLAELPAGKEPQELPASAGTDQIHELPVGENAPLSSLRAHHNSSIVVIPVDSKLVEQQIQDIPPPPPVLTEVDQSSAAEPVLSQTVKVSEDDGTLLLKLTLTGLRRKGALEQTDAEFSLVPGITVIQLNNLLEIKGKRREGKLWAVLRFVSQDTRKSWV
jgi:hypothetical protein